LRKKYQKRLKGSAETALDAILHVLDKETVAKEHIFSKEFEKKMYALQENGAAEIGANHKLL